MNILFIIPHCSTGGLPQFLLNKIQQIQLSSSSNVTSTHVIEFNNYSNEFTVQREELKKISVYTILDNLEEKIKIDIITSYIRDNRIDLVWFEEIPETFISIEQLERIYANRNYNIIESAHGKPFIEKYVRPDLFIVPSSYSIEYYNKIAPTINWFPTIFKKEIDQTKKNDKINVLNIGLFCENKNQKEVLQYAKKLSHINFHLVGNSAFKDYWESIRDEILKLKNVIYHGELNREEIDKLYRECDIFLFTSKNEYNPLVIAEAASYGLDIITHKHESCDFLKKIERVYYIDDNIEDNYNIINYKNEHKLPITIESERSIESILSEVISINLDYKVNVPLECNLSYKDGAKLVITQGWGEYQCIFIDESNGQQVDICTLKKGMFRHLSRKWIHPLRVDIYQNGNKLQSLKINFEDSTIYISIKSNALGDTIAAIPYIEQFREKYKCNIILSTSYNSLFEKEYLDIKFVSKEEIVYNFDHSIFIYWDIDNKSAHKQDIRLISLQQSVSDQLGLKYEEIRPKIYILNNNTKTEYLKKFVCISTESTGDCKEWQNKQGWQEVINYLVTNGYGVIDIKKNINSFPFKNVINVFEEKLDYITDLINNCKFFIGLGSGSSWIAWALNKKVIMISGFSKPFFEFSTPYRVINENVCNGCFNDIIHKFDRTREWCPRFKNFECTREITSTMVIDKIKEIV